MLVYFKLSCMARTEIPENPFKEKREVYDLLSQETRHLILQNILGHPKHLPSLDELDHMMPKNKASIADQLERLEESGLIREYTHEPNESSRDLPSKFYGLTEEGVEILREHGYMRGIGFARTVYENTRKTEKTERHENASRPELPESVTEALRSEQTDTEKPDSEYLTELTRHITEEKSHTKTVEDLVVLARLMYDEGIVAPDEWASIKDIEKLMQENNISLDFSLRTSVEYLREIDVIERRKPPGPDIFVVGERINEIINGRVEEYAEEEIESLIRHMDEEIERIQTIRLNPDDSNEQTVAMTDGSGKTIRQVLAQKFGVPSEDIEKYLREGNKISKLNEAVQAIKQHDELKTGEGYGEILFLAQPHQYSLVRRLS